MSSGVNDRQALGKLGEEAAAQLYIKAGYRVVERNRHESHNEIDLIAENDTSLVFVEVKTRTQHPGVRSRFGRPALAVDAGKRHRTVLAAESYLRTHPTDRQPRIDVVEVYIGKSPDGTPTILSVLSFRNAFGAGE